MNIQDTEVFKNLQKQATHKRILPFTKNYTWYKKDSYGNWMYLNDTRLLWEVITGCFEDSLLIPV